MLLTIRNSSIIVTEKLQQHRVIDNTTRNPNWKTYYGQAAIPLCTYTEWIYNWPFPIKKVQVYFLHTMFKAIRGYIHNSGLYVECYYYQDQVYPCYTTILCICMDSPLTLTISCEKNCHEKYQNIHQAHDELGSLTAMHTSLGNPVFDWRRYRALSRSKGQVLLNE